MVLIALRNSQPFWIWRGVAGRNLPTFRENLLSGASSRRININLEYIRITLFQILVNCHHITRRVVTKLHSLPMPKHRSVNWGVYSPAFGVPFENISKHVLEVCKHRIQRTLSSSPTHEKRDKNSSVENVTRNADKTEVA